MQQLGATARIVNVGTSGVEAQGAIGPRGNLPLCFRAGISNRKSLHIPAMFRVQQSRITRPVRLQFWIQTGYNTSRPLAVKANVTKRTVVRVTGHFIVPLASGQHIALTAQPQRSGHVALRARIG